MMHGFYSFGTLVGAGAGYGGHRVWFTAMWHIFVAALIGIAPIAIAIKAIPEGTGKNAAEDAHHQEKACRSGAICS